MKLMRFVAYVLFLFVDAFLVLWLYDAGSGAHRFEFNDTTIAMLRVIGFLLSLFALAVAHRSLPASRVRPQLGAPYWVDIAISALALGTAFYLTCMLLLGVGLPFGIFAEVAQYGLIVWIFGLLMLAGRFLFCMGLEVRRGMEASRQFRSFR